MKKIYLKLGAIALLAAGTTSLAGCGGGNETEDYEEEEVQEEKVPEIRPSLVNVYIDGSGSMGNYFGKIGIDTISEALNKLELVPDSFKVRYYVWGNSTEIPRDQLTTRLLNKDLKGKSTVFSEILGPMATQSGGDTLSVLITDGILSSSAAQTKIDGKFTDYDKVHLENNIIKELQGKGKAISIYRMMGNYNGNYYNKANKTVPYTGKRPFYVIVMGEPATVRYFDDEAQDGELGNVYKEAESIHIGTAPTKMQFRIEPVDGEENQARGEYFDREEGTTIYAYTCKEGFRVSAKLPDWVEDNYSKQTIRRMSTVTINGEKVPGVDVNVDDDYVIFNIPESVVDKYYHSPNGYTITYTMTDPSAGAWDIYSTDDDTTPDAVSTYLLKEFVGAMRKGTVGSGTNLLESSMTVKAN